MTKLPDHRERLEGSAAPATLPDHIQTTVAAIAQLHADHKHAATPLQRLMDRLTAGVADPRFVGFVVAAAVVWVAGNLLLSASGRQPLDPPPFVWLQGVIGFSALCMTSLVLTTQRREDELATRREQLTLELAILGEQKTAKIIALIEELRRDDPGVRSRPDPEARAMSAPADPQEVLGALDGPGANRAGHPDRSGR
jgi:uncharacterized membrane protein